MNTYPNITVKPGAAVVDSWAPVTNVGDLRGYAALEAELPLWEEGRAYAWLVEMDTKYTVGEVSQGYYDADARYVATPTATVSFYTRDGAWGDIVEEEAAFTTDFTVDLPTDGTWTARVLGGRYDHLIVITRQD